MLRRFDFLIPPFLRNLDRRLLMERPGLWATQIHYVVWFVLLGGALAVSHALLRKVSPDYVPDVDLDYGLMFIPAIIGGLFWAFRLSRFSVEKNFGQKLSPALMRDQAVYGLTIVLLTLIPYVYGETLAFRVSRLLPKAQVSQHIEIFDQIEGYINSDVKDDFPYKNAMHPGAKIEAFIEAYNLYSDTDIRYSAEELILAYRKNPDFEPVNNFWEERSDARSNAYRIHKAQLNDHIFDSRNTEHVTFMFGGMVWLILLVFVRLGWKMFLTTALSGFLISMGMGLLSSLLMMVTDARGPEPLGFLWLGFFAFLVFQAFRRSNTRLANSWKTISLSIATLMTPFVPLLVIMATGGSNDLNFGSRSAVEPILFMYICAGISIVLWNTLYQPQFTRLLALPKDN